MGKRHLFDIMLGTSGGTTSILWTTVFYVLCIELVLVGLLCLPMPTWVRRPFLNLIAGGALDGCIGVMKWVFGIIFVLFCDAIRQTMSGKDLVQQGRGGENFAAFKDNQAK